MLKRSKKILAWVALLCMILSVSLNSYTAAADETSGTPQVEGEQTPAGENAYAGDVTRDGEGQASNWPQPLIDLANSYYGENGHVDLPPVYVNIKSGPSTYSDGPDIDSENILAGQTLYYKLEYGLAQAKNFPDPPYDPPQPLYDDFYNAQLTVTLPAGLRLIDNGKHYGMSCKSVPEGQDPVGGFNLDVPHTYTIDIPKDANGRYPITSEDFDLIIFVGNNGTDKSLNTYNLSECVSFTASFDIVDKTSELPYPQNVVAQYTKTAKAGMDPVTTVTPDVWGVNKAESKAPVVNQTANTVTYEWKIDVGLVSGKDENGRSVLKPNANQYTRFGADELTSLSLKDAIDVYLNGNTTPFDFDPVSVTIQKSGSGNTAVPLFDANTNLLGQNIVVWGDNANPHLKMNESQNPVLDKDGDKTADTKTPIFTSYTVKAVYDVSSLSGEFYDSIVGTLKADNDVDITAVLADGHIPPTPITQTDDDDADSLATLYKKQPAKINIVKKIQLLNEGEKTYDGRFGTITYTLTAANGDSFKLYVLNDDGSYSKFYEGTSATITDITKAYYVLPGSFKLKETIDPNHSNEMRFLSVSAKEANSNNPIAGANLEVTFDAERSDDWTITFKNQESKGKIIITKNDEKNQPLEGVKFQLKDANGNIIPWIDPNTNESSDKMTTNNTGMGEYNNLPFGTYYLDETDPRPGYAKEGTWPKEIKIGDGEGEYIKYEPVYSNTKTKATITLTKYVGRAEASHTKFPQAGANNKDCGTFVLQRTTKTNPTEDDWVDVTTDVDGVTISTSLNDSGKITADVAATDANNVQYKYRFVETVASGYYPVVENADGTYTNQPTATTSATQPKTVAIGGQQEFKMYNRQKVVIRVYKHFYHYGTNGAATQAAVTTNGGTEPDTKTWTIPVDLYRWDGTGADAKGNPTSVSQLQHYDVQKTAGYTAETSALWENLVIYDTNKTWTYYVKETLPTSGDGSDYTIFGLNGSYQGKTYIEIPANSGNRYVKIDMSANANTYQAGLINYLDAIPIRIRKLVGTGNTTLAGCKVNIYTDEACTQFAYDAQTGNKLENVLLPQNTTGQYIYLKSGQKYYYKEVVDAIPSGYTFMNLTTDNSSTYDDSTTTTTTNLGTIDLTNVKQPTMQNRPNNSKYKTYTVRNKPNPGVTFTKKTMGQQNPLAGAKFAIFTRTGTEGHYSYNFVTDFTTGSDGKATKTLAAGTYYVAEIQMPSSSSSYTGGFLNPNSANGAAEYNRVANLYSRKVDGTNVISYYYDANGTYTGDFTKPSELSGLTFTEFTVSDSIKDFTFYDIYLKEKVQVKKTVDGKDVSIAGFTVEIYKADANGNPTGDPIKTAQTGNNGIAQFGDLDIYDENGNRITYVVKEGPASGWGTSETHDDLVKKYYFVSDGQTFQLEVQERSSDYNTKDLEGNRLQVNNATNIQIKAVKYQQDGWQMAHGGMRFTMDGAKIGLYRRVAVAEGQTPNSWEAVKDENNQLVTAITKNGGQVSFDNLPRGTGSGTSAVQYEYALVELASNDAKYFPYQENPKNAAGSAWKAYPTEGASISDAALKEYNALVLPANKISTETTEYKLDEVLINSTHWVQFHIKKWLDAHPMHNYYRDGVLIEEGNVFDGQHGLNIGDENGHRRWNVDRNPGSPDTALDDCAFSLYRYVLPDNVNSVAFDRSTWTLIGTYTSGQLLDSNNNPIAGEFLTDIDIGVNDNYVYVLVEDNVGPNSAIINPYYRYTFWYSKNHAPVGCTLGEGGSTISRAFTYEMDTTEFDRTNHTDILNSREAGPGEGNILLAALRLTKWRDSYDEDGKRKQEYEPLNNVHFTVSLTDGTIIAEMTTGLDGDTNVAKAQSGVFQLVFGTGENVGKTYLREYEVPNAAYKEYEVTKSVTVFTDSAHPSYKIYGVEVNIKESGAPEGYGYYPEDYKTYLIFVDKDPNGTGNKFRFFSDLYFVTTTDKTIHLAEYQEDRLWHATEAISDNPLTLGDPLQRIVDYPMVNTYVEIRKVGYAPTNATVELAATAGADYSEKIAKGNYGAVHLSGVTMKLQRLDEEGDGTWKDWDYSSGDHGNWGTKEFTTLSEGEFVIPKGLKMGKYRVYETSLGTQASKYENAYLFSEGHYREFTVGGVPITIYMANPEKIDLKLLKKNMGTNDAVSGMTFKLGRLTPTESPAGTYTFSNIPTGTYKLTEPDGPSNISIANFAAWFAATYPDLAALVNSGMKLGYTYTGPTGEDGAKDVSITAISPWDSSNNKVLELEILNPAKTSVTLKKYDLDDGTALNGSAFLYFYKPFGTLSGDVSVDLPTIADGTKASDVRTAFTSAGWTDKTNGGDPINVPTGGHTFDNLEPGIYAFYETGAPSGYDRLIINNNVVIYSAVVTGGLPVNVTVTPSSVKLDESDEDSIVTNFQSTTGASVEVKAQDPKKASIQAKKTVNAGDLRNSDIGNWSVTLNLYDAEDGGEVIGSATITKSTQNNTINFKKGDSTAYFSVGKTYYLEEVVNVPDNTYADATHFILTTVKIGDTVITLKEGETRYAIPVETAGTFVINVTNQYLYGRVDFRKYDAATEKILKDAEFEVLHKVGEDWVVVPGSRVDQIKENNVGTGKYTAFIPLDSADATDYRIRETVAPPDFVLNPDPDKRFFTVSLKFDPNANPHGNVKDFTVGEPVQGTYLNNSQGTPLEIIKYNNIKGSTTIGVATPDSVRFTLYHYDTTVNPAVWRVVVEKPVEGNAGKITFNGEYLLAPFETYAVAETYANSALYNRLDGIYVGNDKQTLESFTAVKPNGTTVSVNDAYVFTNDGSAGTISFSAYNVPYLKPSIIKLDVGHYPDDVYARMNFKVFEVDKDFVADDTNVANLVATCTNTNDYNTLPRIVFQGNTSTHVNEKVYPDIENGTPCNGTSIIWENSGNIKNRWDPSKTYVLVETKVFGDGNTYDTMVKDDPRVVWYLPIAPVALPTGSEEFILANINGVADVELDKAVVPSEFTSTAEAANKENSVVEKVVESEDKKSTTTTYEVESLLTGDRKVVYTISPTVKGKNQMLKSFVLRENGLTVGTPVAPDYTITGVVVGSATQVLPAALGLESASIKATVTYYSEINGSNGTGSVLGQPVVLGPGEDEGKFGELLTAPNGTKSFEITYYSPEVTLKAPAYVLAEEFKPSATTVYMTVKRILDGTVDADGTTHPATEITQFTNKSEVSLSYDKWADDGLTTTEVTPSDDDTAVIDVTKQVIPLVSINKTSDSTTASAGGYVKYTLTITNKDDSPADFVNPVLIDVLPTGLMYVHDADHEYHVGTGHLGETFTIDYIASKEGNKVRGEVEVGGIKYSDPERCVIIRLNGRLKPKSFVEVSFWAYVTPSAVAYDTLDPTDPDDTPHIHNDVYLSSTAPHTYHTTKNPYGFTFAVDETTTGYVFGESITDAASHNSDAALQESGVHGRLSEDSNYPFTNATQYVWVTDSDEIPVGTGNKLNLHKAVQGDQDNGFHDTGVGIATRTVDPATQTHNKSNGTVDWKLTINNGNNEPAENIVVGDAIPKEGDDRNRKSHWDVIFDSFTNVTYNNSPVSESLYTIWYYTGPVSEGTGTNAVSASDVIKQAMTTVRTWTGTTHGDTWSTTKPTDASKITGFIIVFSSDFTIKVGYSAVITYHTLVKNYPDDEDFADNRAFQNATNDFFVFYKGYSLLQVSNPVSVTLMDAKVQVEGDVWIDEDWDHKQQSTGNRRDYSKYTIINELTEAIGFNITDGRNNDNWNEDDDHGTNINPGFGESIRHFTFTDLGAAAYVAGRTLYGQDNYLNVGLHKIPGQMIALKGTDPFHYYLGAEILGTNKANILKVFSLTDRGTGHYMSDDPDHELTAIADNSLDSNFSDDGNGVYSTYPFYVRYSNRWDQSKDIGFRSTRGLEITKVAKDNPNEKVGGAKFQMYGPFGDREMPQKEGEPVNARTEAFAGGENGTPLTFTKSEVTEGEGENAVTRTIYTLDPNGTVTELETDENGKIYVEGLNWWKEYDIKETTPEVETITVAKIEDGDSLKLTDDFGKIITIEFNGTVPKADFISESGLEVGTTIKIEENTNSAAAEGACFIIIKKADANVYIANAIDKNGGVYAVNSADIKPYGDVADVYTSFKDAAGYSIVGATATGDLLGTVTVPGDGEDSEPTEEDVNTLLVDYGNGCFTLRVPSTYRTTAMNTDKLTVADPRNVKVKMNVEKQFNSYSTEKDFVFTFTLNKKTDPGNPNFNWVTDRQNRASENLTELNSTTELNTVPIDTKTVTIKGSSTGGSVGYAEFKELTLYGEGIYHFTITEAAKADTDPETLVHDARPVKDATVTVTWNDTKKCLEASVVYSNSHTAPNGKTYELFTNEYTDEIKWTPDVTKKLTGRPIVPGEFNFSMYKVVTGDDGEPAESKIADAVVAADGTVTFPEQTYTLQDKGEHVYKIYENAGTDSTISYNPSNTVVTATVVIGENSDGKLTCIPTYSPEDKTFINTWSASGEWTPVVKKKMTVKGIDDAYNLVISKTFEATVTCTDTGFTGTNPVLTGRATVASNGDPVDFTWDRPGKVSFTQADVGTHTYKIKETYTTVTVNGVRYDESEHEVKVKVELHKNGDGTYSNVLDVTWNKGTATEPIIFNNEYDATGKAQFKVDKILISGETRLAIAKDQFTFVLLANENDAAENALQRKTTPAKEDRTNAEVVFDEITYTLAQVKAQTGGKFTYYIKELDTSGHNMVYDSHVLKVEVTPVDDGKGKLVCTPVYYVKDDNGAWQILNTTDEDGVVKPVESNPTFTNEQLYGLKIWKWLDDDAASTSDERFNFTLTLFTTETEGETTTNVAYTGVVFEDLVFSGGTDDTAKAKLAWTEGKDDDGKGTGVYTFTLAHNETVELKLPIGVNYVINEHGDGFNVLIEKLLNAQLTDSTYAVVEQTDKYTATGSIIEASGDQVVKYTNARGSVLPLTGGRGTAPITAVGLMMILAALGCGMILRFRRKGDEG